LPTNDAPTRRVDKASKSPFDLPSDGEEPPRKLEKQIIEKPVGKHGLVSRMRAGTKRTMPSDAFDALVDEQTALPQQSKPPKQSTETAESAETMSKQEQMDMDMQMSINKMLQTQVAPASHIKQLTSLIGGIGGVTDYEPPESARRVFEEALMAEASSTRQYAARTYSKSHGRRVLGLDAELNAAADDEPIEDADLGVDAEVRVTSLHELKESGEMRKFLDNMDYTMEGLNSSDKSIRRTTSLVLAKELMQPDFLDKICTHKYPTLISNCLLQHKDDAVLELLWFILTLLLTKDVRAVNELLREDGDVVLQTLCKGLTQDDLLDPASSASLPKADWKRAKEVSAFVAEFKLPDSTAKLCLHGLAAFSQTRTSQLELVKTVRDSVLNMLLDEEDELTVQAGVTLLLVMCAEESPESIVAWTCENAHRLLSDKWRATMPLLKLVINLSTVEVVAKRMGHVIPRILELLLENYNKPDFPSDVGTLMIASLVNLVGKVRENRAVLIHAEVGGKPAVPALMNAYKEILNMSKDEMVQPGYWSLLVGCLIRDGVHTALIGPKLPNSENGVSELIDRLRAFSEFQRAFMDETTAKKMTEDFDELIAELMVQ